MSEVAFLVSENPLESNSVIPLSRKRNKKQALYNRKPVAYYIPRFKDEKKVTYFLAKKGYL